MWTGSLVPGWFLHSSSEFGPETLLQKSIRESVNKLQLTDTRFHGEEVLTSELHVTSVRKIRGRWNRRDTKRRQEKRREDSSEGHPGTNTLSHRGEPGASNTGRGDTKKTPQQRNTANTHTHSDGGRGARTHCNHREMGNKHHEKHRVLTVVINQMHRLLL